jgi:hypothetical protein
LAGYFILFVGCDGIMVGISSLIQSALSVAANIASLPPAGVH